MIRLATVSGIATTNVGMIDWFARNVPVSLITTKSIQENPNPGNREPVITEPAPGCFGNAVGLRNPGLLATIEELETLAPRRITWPREIRLNVSIAANGPDGFARLVAALDVFADMLELNLSCPHAHGGYGSDIGRDPILTAECVAAAVAATAKTGRNVPIYAKLTPNTDKIGEIACAAQGAGAAGIVAINTVGPTQYRDPESGEIILSNPAPSWAVDGSNEEEYRGRGGRSGRWIRSLALECVREVRDAVGADLPIIGMGGIECREDAQAMHDAGADIVGVGSALALVEQRFWPEYFSGFNTLVDTPTFQRRETAGMRHRSFRVSARRELGEDFFELELSGSLSCEAGQTVFLWLPGVGEKPFAPAWNDPATFLIRRRGPVTRALGKLAASDPLYLRGPYGRGVEESGVIPRGGGSALILAAGTGLAPVPGLLVALSAAGYSSQVMWGVRSTAVVTPLSGAFASLGARFHRVDDNGEEGRVLRVFGEGTGIPPDLVIAIGPEEFMQNAAIVADNRGVPGDRIVFSLEKTMLCGVGLCGACESAGMLTCQYGTFLGSREVS